MEILYSLVINNEWVFTQQVEFRHYFYTHVKFAQRGRNLVKF
jgi:hypothetical protein